MIKRFLIVVAVMVCSMSAWAGGNYSCQFTGYGATGNGTNAQAACKQAAVVVCPMWVATWNTTHTGTGLRQCTPSPLDVDPYSGYICQDGVCNPSNGAQSHMCTSSVSNPSDGACHEGPTVSSNSQASTGTSWGTQYGSPHTYDSVAGTTPDTITYIGPEDGNMSVEIDANHGLNSTSISGITMENSWGTNVGTVTHVQSSPSDIWSVTGTVSPGSSYTLGVTFSHTGGYGEYAVKMAGASAPQKSLWIPVLQFGTSSAGITYSTQQGSCKTVDKHVTCWVYIALSSKGTATGNATITGLPYLDDTSYVAASGTGPAIWSGLTLTTGTQVVLEVYNGLVDLEIPGTGAVTNSSFTNTSVIEGSFTYISQ